MRQNLSQPEEIDLVLKEMENSDMPIDRQVTNKIPSAQASQEIWNTGYGSPYRAAYIKAHCLDM